MFHVKQFLKLNPLLMFHVKLYFRQLSSFSALISGTWDETDDIRIAIRFFAHPISRFPRPVMVDSELYCENVGLPYGNFGLLTTIYHSLTRISYRVAQMICLGLRATTC